MHGQCDAQPTVSFHAAEHHHLLASNKLNCLVTEAQLCERLAESCYTIVTRWELNPQLLDCKSNSYAARHPRKVVCYCNDSTGMSHSDWAGASVNQSWLCSGIEVRWCRR